MTQRSRGDRSQLLKRAAAVALGLAMVLGGSAVTAQADGVDLTPGPHIIADPNSPTGYTGHFVFYNPTATSVRFVADILLRDWNNPTSPTVYQPQQYRPGLMRGGGAYDVQMTNAGGGYWYTDVPLAAGPNQYWFYVNNNTNLWVADPANSPIFAPDGLTGTARRAFNAVYVPYDPVKQNYAPLAERVIANPRPDTAKGTWSYVPIQIGTSTRTLGVYLPPGYDPNRAQPYKTIYLQHGSGQDQSDWLNIGSVPIIMDNLIADGQTEPAVIVTTNSAYMGASPYTTNLDGIIIPFVQSHYNVSTNRVDRAFAGLSMGGSMTINIINNNPLRFGYYGVFSWTPPPRTTTANIRQAYIYMGCGAWDNLNLCVTPAQLSALSGFPNFKFDKIAGGHDFNSWPQLFAQFAKSYVWQRGAFVNGAPVFTAGGESQSVDEGSALSFGVDATDPDGDALTYSASNLPDGASFDATTKQFSWTPDYSQAGTYTVTFSASDGTKSYSLSGSKVVTITVGDVNRAPSFTAGGESQSVDENSDLSFTVAATDPDGDALTYSASNLPEGAAFDADTQELTWTPDYSQAGDYTVTFTAEDSGHANTLSATKDVTITVGDVNRAPSFTAGGESQSVDENRALSFSVEATDPDGDTLTYSASGLPSGAGFDADTQEFSWTPDYTQAGTYTVTFTATDAGHSTTLSATKDVTITVRNVTVAEQLAGLKAAVAGLSAPSGVKNGLTVKLTQAAKLLAQGDTAGAVHLLSVDFIGQVDNLLAEGKLTAAQAAALITAAEEAVDNITS